MNIGFVIPVYKEPKIAKTVSELKSRYKDSTIIVISDDQISSDKAKRAGAIVPLHVRKKGFGKSLIEGINLAWFTYDCDIVVTLDVDHSIKEIDKLLKGLRGNDVCVGYEQGGWTFSRKFSNWLVRFLLFADVYNPTCGFVAWKSSLLKEIPWKHIRSKWDAIHPELLFWAWKRGADISEAEFSEVKKKRRYGLWRHMSWFISFMRLLRLKYCWWWRYF